MHIAEAKQFKDKNKESESDKWRKCQEYSTIAS